MGKPAVKHKKKKKFQLGDYFKLAPKGTHIDRVFLLITVTLLAFGLVVLYSASYVRGIYERGDSFHYIKDQLIFAVIGLAIMLFVQKLDYHIYRKYAFLLLGITYILLIIVLFMEPYNGCKRWIYIPGAGTFQPSEIAKFAVILMFAHLLDVHHERLDKFKYGIIPFAIILALIAGLMLLEPHLSGTIIIFGIAAIMMFVGGVRLIWFIGAGAAAVTLLITVLAIKPDLVHYASDRIEFWLHPENDLLGKGYQSYMAKLAIGSGGLMGTGLGNGRQKHLHLPEPQNDFIFAVACEELGFIGGCFIIILFIALFVRGYQIAFKAQDKFGGLLALGITTQIALQACLNVAVATGTIPNTGISLPFFSEGGTSLMMILAEIGIVLSISRDMGLEQKPAPEDEKKHKKKKRR